jgi:hypothetical protein
MPFEEIDAHKRPGVIKHFMSCPECQELAQSLEAVWALLDAGETIEPSPNFKAHFWRKASVLFVASTMIVS